MSFKILQKNNCQVIIVIASDGIVGLAKRIIDNTCLVNTFIFFHIILLQMFVSISVDKFSFPSGHATRAVGLALLFTFLLPFPPFLLIPIYIWSAAVCTSRVCLGRHHVLDIIGGVIVGIAEIFLMSFLWMDDDTAKNVGNSLFGEDPWSNA